MIEKEARSVDEALEEICRELGKKPEEIEIVSVEEKPRGLLGLRGNKRVTVRARVREDVREKSEDEGLEYAKTVLERIVLEISDRARVEGRIEEDRIHLNIWGDGSGVLIGRHGQTLDAIQYIVGRIVGKRLGEKRSVVVDSEAYRERKKETLEELARRMGEKAKSTGRVVELKPLNARDRRTIHIALKGDDAVETKSAGQGEMKRVRIIPRGKGNQGSVSRETLK